MNIKLNDAEREYLKNNNGCFWCHKINTDHTASDCSNRLESMNKAKEVKKESVSALGAVVESDSESEYPRSSVPTIKLATIIENTAMPSSLVDCGVIISLISSNDVEKHVISTHSTSLV